MPERHLSRSKDGSTIHRDDCPHARLPWNYADRISDDELLLSKMNMGLRVCKKCEPTFRSEPTL